MEGTLFKDRWGFLRIGWGLALVALGGGALIAFIIFAVAKPINEASCNANVERLASPLVVDGDYDLWADQCFVTLTNGRTIPFSQHRTIERENVIG